MDIRNIFEGVTYLGWQGHTFSSRLRPEFPLSAKVSWCIPASHVLLHPPNRPSRGDAENPVEGVITDMLALGETVRVEVAIGTWEATVSMEMVRVRNRKAAATTTRLMALLRITASKAAKRNAPISNPGSMRCRGPSWRRPR